MIKEIWFRSVRSQLPKTFKESTYVQSLNCFQYFGIYEYSGVRAYGCEHYAEKLFRKMPLRRMQSRKTAFMPNGHCAEKPFCSNMSLLCAVHELNKHYVKESHIFSSFILSFPLHSRISHRQYIFSISKSMIYQLLRPSKLIGFFSMNN